MLACVASGILWMNWHIQSFCILDSQRTAIKTSKLAPPKNFYLFMIFTNIKNRCYYKRRTTRKTKVFAREKFSQIFTDVFTITKFLCPWFSKNRCQNLETGATEKPIHDFHEHNNSFRHNSIHCRRRHRWYNYKRSLFNSAASYCLPRYLQT